MEKTIIHFGVKIRKTERLLLNRENYCIPSNKIGSADKYMLKKVNVTFPNKMFKDMEHYTDEYVEKHYEDCMLNYDLNIKYFESLDEKDFNNKLEKFLKKNKFKEVLDLNEFEKDGVYVLVLGKYKQIYIGISDNVKRRILRHWSQKKEFGRLIYGDKYTSILSVDSFGALDTTKIYYKNSGFLTDLFSMEQKLVEQFDKKYLINRVAGGINEDNDNIRNLELYVSRNRRELN